LFDLFVTHVILMQHQSSKLSVEIMFMSPEFVWNIPIFWIQPYMIPFQKMRAGGPSETPVDFC